MKTLLLTLCATVFVAVAAAQQVGQFEGEVGVSLPVAAKKLGSRYEPAWNAYAEGRCNLKSVPVDMGFQVQYGAFYREWRKIGLDRDFRFLTFLAVTDYNFRRTKNISFFVGLGAGMSAVSIEHSDLEAATRKHTYSACILPRVGIEFFHHVRLTAGYRLMNEEYSSFELSLGVVFGGGRR